MWGYVYNRTLVIVNNNDPDRLSITSELPSSQRNQVVRRPSAMSIRPWFAGPGKV
jgi:hypothetical protein